MRTFSKPIFGRRFLRAAAVFVAVTAAWSFLPDPADAGVRKKVARKKAAKRSPSTGSAGVAAATTPSWELDGEAVSVGVDPPLPTGRAEAGTERVSGEVAVEDGDFENGSGSGTIVFGEDSGGGPDESYQVSCQWSIVPGVGVTVWFCDVTEPVLGATGTLSGIALPADANDEHDFVSNLLAVPR